MPTSGSDEDFRKPHGTAIPEYSREDKNNELDERDLAHVDCPLKMHLDCYS